MNSSTAAASESPDDPCKLRVDTATVGVIVSWDLGIVKDGTPLSEQRVLGLRQIVRDDRFFDNGIFRPILQYEPGRDMDVVGIRSDARAEDDESARVTRIFAKCTAHVESYVHDFGYAALFLTVELIGPLDTDDLILAAGVIARPEAALVLSGGGEWRLSDALGAVADRLSPFIAGPRTSTLRFYSLVNIHSLAAGLEVLTEKHSTLYDQYEREFHALSVRVIKNWRERYPLGSRFQERNGSVAPTGVVRFNARNVLMFEYPYSSDDVAALYYPALVELRLWDTMATVELIEIKRLIRRIGTGGEREVLQSALTKSRESILRIAGDFEALSACSSKRTAAFYRAGMQEFGLDETLRSIRDRSGQVEDVLSRQSLAEGFRRERELVDEQRIIATNAEDSAERSVGTSAVLRILGVLVGIQVALDVASALKLDERGSILLAAVTLLTLLVYSFAVSRRSRRSGVVALAMEGWVELVEGPDTLTAKLMRRSTRRDIRRVRILEDGDVAVSFRHAQGRLLYVCRVVLRADASRPDLTRYWVRCESNVVVSRIGDEFMAAPRLEEVLGWMGLRTLG